MGLGKGGEYGLKLVFGKGAALVLDYNQNPVPFLSCTDIKGSVLLSVYDPQQYVPDAVGGLLVVYVGC